MSRKNSIPPFLGARELDSRLCLPLRRRLHVTRDFINRLTLVKELDGHLGCVNTLDWDAKGRKLTSASDDLRVVLWEPATNRKLYTFQTGHRSNIFSVKFMPETNEEVIITGAGDRQIRVHNVVSKQTTRVCTCHTRKVKRLATAPSLNDIFWSAAEDGVVRQFDLRCSHSCVARDPTVLVDLRTHCGNGAEAKCIAVNPIKSELIAVGANDAYVRIYDRRMIKLVKSSNPILNVASEDNLTPGCVQHFVPGHTICRKSLFEKYWHKYATHVTFSPNGRDLLVNLGRDNIYLYDLSANEYSPIYCHTYHNRELREPLLTYSNGINSPARQLSHMHKPNLPDHINTLKLCANALFERDYISASIRHYNEAISRYPDSSVLYANRANANIKRNWCGDAYAALRDCITALCYDSNNAKAYFRMSKCLFDLGWDEEAMLILSSFKTNFPSYTQAFACRVLEMKIRDRLELADLSADMDEPDNVLDCSPQESLRRESAKDYQKRFYGHCNVSTDIKEANFFGFDGEFIVAGSDDGSIFFWDRHTTNNIRILKGDSTTVNCVQPHPTSCLLATSGIDSCVRLWSPRTMDGYCKQFEITEKDELAETNHRRMLPDPINIALLRVRRRVQRTAERNCNIV
ncbi:WD and tetratricopeptide repeats protein 1-like isoform X2 [Rhodnius prolixus]|uniref:WD and tetratricopeptide repeats protein 1-like isoform X2 n=1 Tax=Rhodnius prolixus TaxID=13249 RepID=UPI003D18A9C0